MKRLFASAAIVAIAAIGIPVATATTASAAGGVKINPKRLVCSTVPAFSGPQACGAGISVQNTGKTPITVQFLSQGGDTEQFSLANSACNGFTLNPGDSCAIAPIFDPQAAGRFSMTLTFGNSEGATLGKITIVGTATEFAPI